MTVIDCTLTDTQNFARCALRDDATSKTQIAFVIIMVLMLVITGISLRNTIVLIRTNTTHSTKGIIMLNTIILVFCIARNCFYLDGLLQLCGTGYPLYIYELVENTSITVFNCLYAVGAYYWFKMLLIMSVQAEKKRKKISRIICILINLVNVIALIIQIIYYIDEPWTDEDCISASLNSPECHHILNPKSLKIPILLIIISSSLSGVFFCASSFLVSIQLKRIRWLPPVIYRKVQKLAIACVAITLIRIIQDLVQVIGNNAILSLKNSSQIDDNFAWPLYCFFYLLTVDILAALLFVLIFAPKGARQVLVNYGASIASPRPEDPLVNEDEIPASRNEDEMPASSNDINS